VLLTHFLSTVLSDRRQTAISMALKKLLIVHSICLTSAIVDLTDLTRSERFKSLVGALSRLFKDQFVVYMTVTYLGASLLEGSYFSWVEVEKLESVGLGED